MTPNSRRRVAKRSGVIDVWLDRCIDEEDPKKVTWAGEWDLLYQGASEEDAGYENLEDLVEDVLDFAERFSKDFDITIEWTITGDPPPDGTVEEVIDALGITLPDRPDPAGRS